VPIPSLSFPFFLPAAEKHSDLPAEGRKNGKEREGIGTYSADATPCRKASAFGQIIILDVKCKVMC
jgi:hypothetical protein